jgi:hypothetical protein
MRESRTYGSVRGALSNGRPYRVRCFSLRRVTTQSGHVEATSRTSALGSHAGLVYEDGVRFR